MTKLKTITSLGFIFCSALLLALACGNPFISIEGSFAAHTATIHPS